MASETETTSKPLRERTGRPELLGLVLVISLPAGLIGLWASPRPARPAEMPPLVLPAAEVAADLAAQDEQARGAPDEDDEEATRRELYLAHGLAEVRLDEFAEQTAAREAHLTALTRRMAEASTDTLAAVRARDVVRGMNALRGHGGPAGEGRLEEQARASELGAFPTLLERYGAVVQGHRVASEIVIRSMFLARWNAIHGLPMTDGMTRLERRAYYGWLALEGGAAPIGMRIEALDEYEAAGGTRVWEARGVLAYESGEMAEAREDFEHAADLTGSLRMRNHALEAERVAIADVADP